MKRPSASATAIARRRYRPAQWDDVRDWRTYAGTGGDRWFGFDAVRSLDGLPPEILMVPLLGHTWGHAGVAVDTGSGWVLNAGDAYFYRREMDGDRRRCTPGLRAYQRLMDTDREQRFANQGRLRDLKRDHGGEVTIFCSHDQKELEALQKLSGTAPPLRVNSKRAPGRAGTLNPRPRPRRPRS